jgi:hypothetical protein
MIILASLRGITFFESSRWSLSALAMLIPLYVLVVAIAAIIDIAAIKKIGFDFIATTFILK